VSWNAPSSSSQCAKQLALEDKTPLLIFFACLISLVVFPADRLIALFAFDISHDVSACCHISLHCFGLFDVNYRGEKERFAMLASEIARDDVVEVGEVGFAVLWRPGG
jgi:hypothetical protein